MAHFYAEIQGNRGAASRMGSKSSGMVVHVRGWDVGVRVYVAHHDGEDVVHVHRTGGSNGRASDQLLLVIHEDGRVDRAPDLMEQLRAVLS